MVRSDGNSVIAPDVAASLGFPKAHHCHIERERRWICRRPGPERIVSSEDIVDLYVTGSRLRLRSAHPRNNGPPMLRLTRKADVDPRTRLYSSIYLSEEEFALLANILVGARIEKTRHRLFSLEGVTLAVDEFYGPLQGLMLAEAEFPNQTALEAFATPKFAIREVTDDQRYTGGHLATHGLPVFG